MCSCAQRSDKALPGFGDFFAGDNTGQLIATFDLITPQVGTPEPGSVLLVMAGVWILLGARRRLPSRS
jgi:hypothetical protein